MAKKTKKKTRTPRASRAKKIAADSVFKHLVLRHVRLISAECKLHISSGVTPTTATTEFSSSLFPGAEGTTLLVNATIAVTSKPSDDKSKGEDGSLVYVSATYQCVYTMLDADAESLKPHGELICGSGTLVAWPHLRELVHSLTSRMEISPFVLPLVTIGPGAIPLTAHEVKAKNVKKHSGD